MRDNIKRPFLFLKRILLLKIIRYLLFDRVRVPIKNKRILFTGISKSILLKNIAIEGYHSYETEFVTLIENYPWHIDLFIDGGAHIGFYSILATLSLDKSVETIAIEPFPENIRYIKEVKKNNNLEFTLIEKALFKRDDQELTFYYPAKSKLPSNASLINSFQGTNGIFKNIPYKTTTISTVSLPTVAGGKNVDTLIKLDCEGSELAILKASPSILKRNNVDFIIEILINNTDKNDLYALMREHGYDAYLLTNSGFVKEERPLTFPYPNIKNRTIWKNHFFTKKNPNMIREASLRLYGYFI